MNVPHQQTHLHFFGSAGPYAADAQWRIGPRSPWQDLALSGASWTFEAGPLEVGTNSIQIRARNIFDEYGATALRTITRLETPYIPGDVNQDGILNVADVTLLARYLDGLAQLPDESLADVNEDGKIGWADLHFLVDLIVD